MKIRVIITIMEVELLSGVSGRDKLALGWIKFKIKKKKRKINPLKCFRKKMKNFTFNSKRRRRRKESAIDRTKNAKYNPTNNPFDLVWMWNHSISWMNTISKCQRKDPNSWTTLFPRNNNTLILRSKKRIPGK